MTSEVRRRFLAAAALLTVVTAGVLYEASRGLDPPGGPARGRRPAAPGGASVDASSPPAIPITIDGIHVNQESPLIGSSRRFIARTVTYSLTTDRLPAIREAIRQWADTWQASIVADAGSPSGADKPSGPPARSITVTLTVPVARGEAARAGVRTLGTVLQELPSTEDLTDRRHALRLRLESAEGAEAERLRSEVMALVARTTVLTIVLKIDGR